MEAELLLINNMFSVKFVFFLMSFFILRQVLCLREVAIVNDIPGHFEVLAGVTQVMMDDVHGSWEHFMSTHAQPHSYDEHSWCLIV